MDGWQNLAGALWVEGDNKETGCIGERNLWMVGKILPQGVPLGVEILGKSGQRFSYEE